MESILLVVQLIAPTPDALKVLDIDITKQECLKRSPKRWGEPHSSRRCLEYYTPRDKR